VHGLKELRKQRLPIANIYHEEKYISDDEVLKSQLKQYNTDISAYYAERTNGSRAEQWTEGITSQLKDTNVLEAVTGEQTAPTKLNYKERFNDENYLSWPLQRSTHHG
jgi:hypothetical protein